MKLNLFAPVRRSIAIVGALAILATAPTAAAQMSMQPTARESARVAKPRKVPRPTTRSLEYRLSWGLASIKADRAYTRGLDGRGVTVAMIDTGLDAASMGLFGSVSPASTDLIKRRGNGAVSDHGRQTAALLAAALDGQGTVGLAHGASLLSIRIDADAACAPECYAYAGDLARAIDYALDNGARIIGVPMVGRNRLTTIEPALERAAAAGAVIVMAAGNDGRTVPDWPARYAHDPRFRNLIVIAGASDMNGQIAPWSNKAGNLGDRFIAAPGENLLVDCDARTCRLVSGTSYSVPYVAGALSLIMAARPDLSAQRAARILLASAADRNDRGVDPVAGRGLLDLSKALRRTAELSS